MPSTPGYDIYDRERIYSALEKIKDDKSHTWVELAAQVQAHTGVLCDRKYFARLQKGNLRNELVHAIVQTIEAKHRLNFTASLFGRGVSALGGIASDSIELLSGSYLDWSRTPRDQTQNLVDRIHYPQAFPLDPKQVEIASAPLSFCDNAHVLRLTNFATTPSTTCYLYCSPKISFPLDGSREVRDMFRTAHFSIGKHNCFDFVRFYLEYVLDEDIKFISEFAQIQQLSPGVRLQVLSQENLEDLLVPTLSLKEGIFFVNFATLKDDTIYRTSMRFSRGGTITEFSHDERSKVQLNEVDENHHDFGFAPATVHFHPHAARLRASLHKHCVNAPVGQLLLKACEFGHVDFLFYSSRTPDSTFEPTALAIFVLALDSESQITHGLALKCVRSMRYADQQLMGFSTPDFRVGAQEYATMMHGKALDALMYMCKFIKETSEESVKQKYIECLSKSEKNLFEAYVDGASNEQLFDIYTQT